VRFVWAVSALVLAGILIVGGVLQRTVFLGPKSIQAELSFESESPFLLIDSETLSTNGDSPTVLVRGQGEIFLAYGRTVDVHAWLSESSHGVITANEQGTHQVTQVRVSSTPDPTPTPTPEPEPEQLRHPAGSDLWLAEFNEHNSLIAPLQMSDGMSVIIAGDGASVAPGEVVLSWPVDNSTPWVGPMLVGGVLLLGLGTLLLANAIKFNRRGPGPKRKGSGPLPPTEPIGRIYTSQISTVAPASRRSRRNRILAIPALGLSLAMLSGCTSDVWPQFGAEAVEPSPTTTAIVPDEQQAPAVTEAQAHRILQKISATVTSADIARDEELLATRMTGVALTERLTNYQLREKLPERALPDAIPTENLTILLPQAFDGWPRTVLTISQANTETPSAPVMIMMVQQDPWHDYQIHYLAEMLSGDAMPKLAPAWIGSQLIPPDSPFMRIAPNQLSSAFISMVDTEEPTEYDAMFDDETAKLIDSMLASRQKVVDALVEHGAASTSKVQFGTQLTESAPLALGTLDGGAIVAIDLIDWERVTPTKDRAVIRLNDEVSIALTGVTESIKGVETKYSIQLFFAVPSTASTEPIRLLAAHQKLISVEVIK
jgi:hypothetical protein